MRKLVITVSVGLISLFVGSVAHASLGQRSATVDDDRVKLSARLSVVHAGVYDQHTLSLDSGTVTKEYSSGGIVFAVSWHGPVRPNLKQIFADYYTQFQADNAPEGRIHMRRAMASTHTDFVVRTGGHSGAFWGFAYLPTQVPSGFSSQVLTGSGQ